MRSIWSGSISFGLVNIPIKLYSAVQDQELSFDMLWKKDLSHIRYKKVAESTGKEVDFKDIVKGYEYAKDKYVIVTEKEFEDASPEKSKAIQIQSFVNEEDIDSVYFDRPYYLEPEKGADKSYVLLLKALKESKMVGIASFILRNREHLAALKPYEDILLLNQMRYESEIRKPDELRVNDEKISTKEMDLALQLIKQLSEPFDASAFKDTYVEKLKKVIEAKAKGKKITVPEVKHEPTQVRDLMSTLKESLNQPKKKKVA